jgi:hypothetical protein
MIEMPGITTCPSLPGCPRVSGVFDLEPALQALESDPGAYLNAKQLEGVAATLEGALALRSVATAAAPANESGSGKNGSPSANGSSGSTHSRSTHVQLLYPALAALAAPISPEEGVIAKAVRHCIKVRAKATSQTNGDVDVLVGHRSLLSRLGSL